MALIVVRMKLATISYAKNANWIGVGSAGSQVATDAVSLQIALI
jgi:hypothetical protein